MSGAALLVVDREGAVPARIPGATVVRARDYLAQDASAFERGTRVVNLCRYDRYQSPGYYVSLLAEARGHAAFPEMCLLGDLRCPIPAALAAPDFAGVLQALLAQRAGRTFWLDTVFGIDPRHAHDALAAEIHRRAPAPALRVGFIRGDDGWRVSRVRALSLGDLCRRQRDVLVEALTLYIARSRATALPARLPEALAILFDEDAPHPPSNRRALAKFSEAGHALGMRVEVLSRRDMHRLPEFGGLFIRDTTNVDHYTFEFARRASAAGLVVIDDPQSILKCTNKVFLQELLGRHGIATPRSLVVHKGNAADVAPTLGLPCVLKQPDSAFSLGVFKVTTREELDHALAALLARSDLVLAQEWLPTTFDWRVGVLDRRPLFVCKYHMAPGHWQVVKHEREHRIEGLTQTMPLHEAPPAVVETAVRAAGLIGDGLYGVDLKEAGGRCCVMEVNDNPNIDAGNEDAVQGDALYREILGVFLRRIRARMPATVA
jgi:glutathione synthase/RimK-type ligase-like ATP-grasp enzyme